METEIYTGDGKMGRTGAFTDTSVEKSESYVLGDNDKELPGGPSVFKTVRNIEEIISPTLVGVDVTDQQAVGHRMIELDGIGYRTNLGGNAIYSVSCATARAAAASVGRPLWKYLAEEEPERVFAPAYNMIDGGTYGSYTLTFRGFVVVPKNISTFCERSRVGVEIFQKIGDIIEKYNNGKPPMMSNYSGYGAPPDDPFVLSDILMEAASSLGCEDKIMFSMNCAASEIYGEARDACLYKRTYVGRDEMISLLSKIAHGYPIGFIKDTLQEEDFERFKEVRKEVQAVLVGDDFICFSIDRAKKAIGMDVIQRMVLEPNQIGTLAEVVETVRFMERRDLLVVASGRAGGIIDDPNTKLTIALGLPIMKTGTPGGGERTIFTSTGLRVEEQLKPGKTMTDVLKAPGFERLG